MNGNSYPADPLLTIYILAGSSNQAWLLQSIHSITSQVRDLPVAVVASINTPSIDPAMLTAEVNATIAVRCEQERVAVDQHCEHCISECASPYIMLFHDDDLLVNGYLRTAVRLLKLEAPQMITTDMEFFTNDAPGLHHTKERAWRQRQGVETLSREQLIVRILRGDAINFASCIYRTKSLQGCNLQELNIRFGKYADRPLMLECAGRAGRILHCTGQTVLTRVHPGQDSQQQDPQAASRRTALLNYYRNELEQMAVQFDRYWTYACWRSLHDCMEGDTWKGVAWKRTAHQRSAVSLLGIVYWLAKSNLERMKRALAKGLRENRGGSIKIQLLAVHRWLRKVDHQTDQNERSCHSSAGCLNDGQSQ